MKRRTSRRALLASTVGATALGLVAVQAANDAGTADCTGAAPPSGQDHRHFITVSTLDIANINLPAAATPAYADFNAFGHVPASATLVPPAATQ